MSDDNENWARGYFAGYDRKNKVIYTFPLGATSWTNEDMGRVEWRYVKLAEGQNDGHRKSGVKSKITNDL